MIHQQADQEPRAPGHYRLVRMKNILGATFRGVLNAPDIAGHAHSKFMPPPHTVNRFTAPHLSCMTAAPAAAGFRCCSFGLLRFWRPPLRSSRKRTVYALVSTDQPSDCPASEPRSTQEKSNICKPTCHLQHGWVLSLDDHNTHRHFLVTLCRLLMPVPAVTAGQARGLGWLTRLPVQYADYFLSSHIYGWTNSLTAQTPASSGTFSPRVASRQRTWQP